MSEFCCQAVAWVKAWWGWVAGGNVPRGSTVLVDRLVYHSHYSALASTRQLVDFEIRLLPSLPLTALKQQRRGGFIQVTRPSVREEDQEEILGLPDRILAFQATFLLIQYRRSLTDALARCED